MQYYRNLDEAVKHTTQSLVESGLSRIAHHLDNGGVGILAAATPQDASQDRYKKLIRRTRELGYGPIVTTGKTKDWGVEKSIVVPGITPGHLKQIGNEFNQKAVIHAPNKNKATMHYLDAAGDQAGTSEDIGKAHFNTPNHFGITVLKGAGFSPKDTRTPTRSFTFKEEIVAVLYPPTGQLNPFWTPVE